MYFFTLNYKCGFLSLVCAFFFFFFVLFFFFFGLFAKTKKRVDKSLEF